MDILILIAGVWGGFLVLSLALAAWNTRARARKAAIEFKVNPRMLGADMQPFRDIVAAKLGAPIDHRAPRKPGSAREVIFVVDDDQDILSLITHVLDLEGFDVRAFNNPVEALAEFKRSEHPPELVVVDYCMNPMNGLELIARCRETASDLKTIVISGMVDEESFQKIPSNTDCFISKPFKISNLIDTLNATLTKSRN